MCNYLISMIFKKKISLQIIRRNFSYFAFQSLTDLTSGNVNVYNIPRMPQINLTLMQAPTFIGLRDYNTPSQPFYREPIIFSAISQPPELITGNNPSYYTITKNQLYPFFQQEILTRLEDTSISPRLSIYSRKSQPNYTECNQHPLPLCTSPHLLTAVLSVALLLIPIFRQVV